jgi:hypothetical protein
MYCISCKKSTEPSEFDIQDLYNTWVHSYEEQNNQKVFRPIDYKEFPASRFRMKYIFKENNLCQWLVLAMDDAHYLQSGTWVQEKSSIFISDSNGTLQENISFSIINLKQKLLEIAPINQ